MDKGKQDYIVKDDMICPVTKAHCDDECCPVGSTCNMSNDGEISFFTEEFKEKMEARRKQLNLKWDGWEENERERQSGGMLIVIAIAASIIAISGALIYIISGL